MSERGAQLARDLRTPKAAAVAGIIFALIITFVILLVHDAALQPGLESSWAASPARRHRVGLALTLVPFAGIAFLWFIGVIRTQLGDLEDRLFSTVFLGSGLLFVATLFSGAAVMGGVLVLSDQPGGAPVDSVRLAGAVATALLGTFAARMAAVFTFVVTSVGTRAGLIPRWLTVVGLLVGLVLLLAPPRTQWAQLLFPTWVLVLSLQILLTPGARRRQGAEAPSTTAPA